MPIARVVFYARVLCDVHQPPLPTGHGVFTAGTVSPQPCGNVTVYCPAGSLMPTAVSIGFYTAAPAPAAAAINATDVMSQAVECPPGSFCAGGERFPCPGGTFADAPRRTAATDCLACSAGWYCPVGSAHATPCGGDTVYCPAGCAAPVPAGPGHRTQGPAGNRVSRSPCAPGLYCPGDGLAHPCPPGRYGDAPGLTNATCSAVCGDGVLCPAQTASPAGQACPAGQYCLAGVGYPCPAGTYNPTTGASHVRQCVLCPAGTYRADAGSTSEAECLPCPPQEGSNPGASECWPGVLGAHAQATAPLDSLAARACGRGAHSSLRLLPS